MYHLYSYSFPLSLILCGFFVFSRFLPHFLLPGPLAYVVKTDSIITCSAAMVLECYKYTVLAAAVNNATAEDASKGQGKRIQVDWSLNLGEHALEIRVGKFSRSLTASRVDIIVLGEHSVFCVKEQGGLRLQKRLDFHPSCCWPYTLASEAENSGANQNLLIGSHTGHIQVYKDVQLVWAARTPSAPQALRVANFGSINGMIVSLDEEGYLRVAYLGTEPVASSVVGTAASQTGELNYDEMNAEHQKLLTVIKEAQTDSRQEPQDKVTIRAQIPPGLEPSPEPDDRPFIARNEDGKIIQMTVRLFVSYSGTQPVDNVIVTLGCPPGLEPTTTSITLQRLFGNRTPEVIPVGFRVRADMPPSSLTVTVDAAFVNEGGEPRAISSSFSLPLLLVARVVPPIKTAPFKVTLDTNRAPVSLSELFQDEIAFVSSSYAHPPTATGISFAYPNQEHCTILVSKNAGRYRLQATSLGALYAISQELLNRLKLTFGASRSAEEPFKISYQEPLPLQEFFEVVDRHFAMRQVLMSKQTDLKNATTQYRILQKRLLVRFKDKNPSSLNHLDSLLALTHGSIVQNSDEIQGLQGELTLASGALAAAVHMLLLLLRYRFELDDNNFAVLRQHLSPLVTDAIEQGWEECTDVALTQLLKTSLAKSAKESAAMPTPLVFPSDTNKLKKHLSLVCDRLAKGGKLYVPPKSDK
eukprot:GILI01003593.1.p1 GENE.GILI01003593.1~~GILI01003593.1.p1  ORF type:complete len:697 (-),score=132.68 GILI01003593.1:484-2574(-)